MSTKAQTVDRARRFPLADVIKRYSVEQRLPLSIAQEHFRELKRYLALCALAPNARYPMTIPIDDAWHTFLLYTERYAKFCAVVGGRFIHHHPKKPMKNDTTAERKAYLEFMRAYERTFGEPPSATYWPRLHADGCTPCNHCRGGTCSRCSSRCD